MDRQDDITASIANHAVLLGALWGCGSEALRDNWPLPIATTGKLGG